MQRVDKILSSAGAGTRKEQGAAQPPALNLEMGKSHGQVDARNIARADEAGVFHGF